MDADALESVLEHMLNLRLDSPPQDSDNGVTDQLAAAVPAQPAAAAENERADQSAVEWAAIIVSQMMSATSVEDAQFRAAKVLEAFGGSVCSRAAQMLGDKDRVLGAAMEQNSILKKAVVAQHRRHLAGEAKVRELQGQLLQYQKQEHRPDVENDKKVWELEVQVLKYQGQLLQYEEQVRRLEADKYALSIHLRNAGSAGSSMLGNFPPEVC